MRLENVKVVNRMKNELLFYWNINYFTVIINFMWRSKYIMNKLFLVLALLFVLSACSIGKKCTYTQDGTKISSWVWFFDNGKPIDLDKNNCN
jgi:hypothetical protein